MPRRPQYDKGFYDGRRRGMAEACDILGDIILEQFNTIKDLEESLAYEYGGIDEWHEKYGLKTWAQELEEKPRYDWTLEEQSAYSLHEMLSATIQAAGFKVGTRLNIPRFNRIHIGDDDDDVL